MEITRVLASTPSPFTLALDGRWGQGKSFVLEGVVEHLRREGHPHFRINAWEIDFVDEPLPVLLHALIRALEGAESDDKKAKNQAIDRVVTETLWGIANLVSSGLSDRAREAFRRSGDGTDERPPLSWSATTEAIAAASKARTTVEQLVAAKGLDVPVVIIIDELDRCRPDFALKFLERSKHFTLVPGVSLLLGVNLEQLSESIRHTYGFGGNPEAYLRKLIDYAIPLPDYPISQLAEFHAAKAAGDGFDLPNVLSIEKILRRSVASSETNPRSCIRSITLFSILAHSVKAEHRAILPAVAALVAVRDYLRTINFSVKQYVEIANLHLSSTHASYIREHAFEFIATVRLLSRRPFTHAKTLAQSCTAEQSKALSCLMTLLELDERSYALSKQLEEDEPVSPLRDELAAALIDVQERLGRL